MDRAEVQWEFEGRTRAGAGRGGGWQSRRAEMAEGGGRGRRARAGHIGSPSNAALPPSRLAPELAGNHRAATLIPSKWCF